MKRRRIQTIQVTPTFRGFEARDEDGELRVFAWPNVFYGGEHRWQAVNSEGNLSVIDGSTWVLRTRGSRSDRVARRLLLRAVRREIAQDKLDLPFACTRYYADRLQAAVIGAIVFGLAWFFLDTFTNVFASMRSELMEAGFPTSVLAVVWAFELLLPLTSVTCLAFAIWLRLTRSSDGDLVLFRMCGKGITLNFESGHTEHHPWDEVPPVRGRLYLFRDGRSVRLMPKWGYPRATVVLLAFEEQGRITVDYAQAQWSAFWYAVRITAVMGGAYVLSIHVFEALSDWEHAHGTGGSVKPLNPVAWAAVMGILWLMFLTQPLLAWLMMRPVKDRRS